MQSSTAIPQCSAHVSMYQHQCSGCECGVYSYDLLPLVYTLHVHVHRHFLHSCISMYIPAYAHTHRYMRLSRSLSLSLLHPCLSLSRAHRFRNAHRLRLARCSCWLARPSVQHLRPHLFLSWVNLPYFVHQHAWLSYIVMYFCSTAPNAYCSSLCTIHTQ